MKPCKRAVSLALGVLLLLDAGGIGLGVAHSLSRATVSRTALQDTARTRAQAIAGADATWRRSGPEVLTHALITDPFRPSVLYASTIVGALRSTDAGAHWQPASAGLDGPDPEIWQIAPTGRRGGLIAAANDGAVYRSSDGGDRWQQAGSRLDPAGVFAVIVDPANPAVLLAGTSAGIRRSGDGGSHWHLAAAPAGSAADTFAWLPGTSSVYAGLIAGPHQLLASADGGSTWRSSTAGLDGQEGIMSLLPVGGERGAVLAGTMGHRIWRTDRQGAWRPSGTGLPDGEHGTALATGGDLLWTSTMTAGVFASADGGRTWHPYGHGLAARGLVVLALTATKGRLLAGTSDGIYVLNRDN